MTSTQTPPKPIIDNLKMIEDPFRQTVFPASQLINSPDIAFNPNKDLEHSLKFLYSYNGSTATFNSYRREIERLLQWAWRVREKSILELKRDEIEAFVRFCIDPPKAWIGTKNVARFVNKEGLRIPNSDWRPFVSSIEKARFNNGSKPSVKQFSLSQSAIQAIFTVLSSFYGYLIEEEVVEANPVLLIRQKSKFIQKKQQKMAIRRISMLQWDYVLKVIEAAALKDPDKHERSLFIMSCLYAMYLRISELASDERSAPVMGDFKKDADGSWWLHVVGKGNKARTITVSDEMLAALKRYRLHLDMPALPSPGEQTPLVQKAKGKGPITSTRQIRLIVQDCFDQAYEKMKKDGLEEDAADLKAATVHWLRHTGISEDVKLRPREHVRDDAGHASMATTDRYIDSDLRERHLSGKKKHIRES